MPSAVYLYAAMVIWAAGNAMIRVCLRLAGRCMTISRKQTDVPDRFHRGSGGWRMLLPATMICRIITIIQRHVHQSGFAMFSLRMRKIERDGKYADTVERALYNTLFSAEWQFEW